MKHEVLKFQSWVNESSEQRETTLTKDQIELLDKLVSRSQGITGYEALWKDTPNGVHLTAKSQINDFNLFIYDQKELDLFKTIPFNYSRRLVVSENTDLFTDTDWLPNEIESNLFLINFHKLEKFTKFPKVISLDRPGFQDSFILGLPEVGIKTTEGIYFSEGNYKVSIDFYSAKLEKFTEIPGIEKVKSLSVGSCKSLNEIPQISKQIKKLNIRETGIRNLNNLDSEYIEDFYYDQYQLNSISNLPRVDNLKEGFMEPRFKDGYSSFIISEDILSLSPNKRMPEIEKKFDDLKNVHIEKFKTKIAEKEITSDSPINLLSIPPGVRDFYLFILDYYGTIDNYYLYKKAMKRLFMD